MNSRERVLNSLNFKPVDKMPKDLAGMTSTGISCFAYRKLIDHLGLKDRPIRVYDTGQMLALPDLDVLELIGSDVVTTNGFFSSAFTQDELWKPYDFNGRLPNGHVLHPENFSVDENGTITQTLSNSRVSKMPASAMVFNSEHAGEPFDLDDDFTFVDLEKLQKEVDDFEMSDEQLAKIVAVCKKTRESTDRAVLFTGLSAAFGFDGGMVQGTMKCLLEPEYIDRLHSLKCALTLKKYEKVIPAIAPYVDIVLITSEDMGSQNAPFIPPETYKELYLKHYHKLNKFVHETAPELKTFIHSCGAIYDIIDHIIDAEFDILNPVQWSAGTHDYKEWKDKARNKICLWGGAINAQHTLPLKTIDEIKAEATDVANYFIQDTGVVFNNCHNILAEITPEKILALYSVADTIKTNK